MLRVSKKSSSHVMVVSSAHSARVVGHYLRGEGIIHSRAGSMEGCLLHD